MTESVAEIKPGKIQQIEQPAGDPIISMIERAARDPNVDIDKMERLFQMHERVAAQQREAAFNAAMAAAQADLEPVVRKSRNTHTNSNYAALDAIARAAQPVIARHGFGLSFGTLDSKRDGYIRMFCDVTHAAGFCKRIESDLALDAAGSQGKTNKTAIQAFGSTTTYGRRYLMCMVFNIATGEDNDGNAAAPTGLITPEQIIEIEALIVAAGADREWIMNHHGIGEFADMSAKDFQKAKAGLTARIRKMKGEASNG